MFTSATEMCLDPKWMRSHRYSSCLPLSFLLSLIFTHYSMATISTTGPGIVSFFNFGKNLSFLSMHKVNTSACDCSVPSCCPCSVQSNESQELRQSRKGRTVEEGGKEEREKQTVSISVSSGLPLFLDDSWGQCWSVWMGPLWTDKMDDWEVW